MAFQAQLDDFAAFYQRTYPTVYRLVLGICVEPSLAADAAQDAYVAAYRERGRFRGDAPAEAWIRRIAVNAALTNLRRQRVRWAEPLDPAIHDRSTAPPDEPPDDDLKRALLRLRPQERAAVVLRFYLDLDYATIAAALETTSGNVGSLLSRALDRLRRELVPDLPMTALSAPSKEVGHGR